MKHNKVQWERMFPDELEAALEACPMVYLPYGLCEPHGWHNAVGMDKDGYSNIFRPLKRGIRQYEI